MKSNLVLRVLSSVVMVPLIWFVIWYGKSVYEDYSIPLFKIFLALLGAGLAWEWDTMFHKKQTISGFWMTLSAVFVAFLAEDNPAFSFWIILLGTTLAYWKSSANLAFSLGAFYVCLPVLALSWLYFANGDSAKEMLLWLFFVVWATDVGGFIVGKTVGGPKLCPKVSPKKTWSGCLGGIVFAMLVAWIFAMFLKTYGYMDGSFQLTKKVLILSAGGLAIVSQIGDLFESYIKRKLDLKDSSNLIPGHGGLFDRMDGLIFAATITALVVCLTGNGGMSS